MEAILQVVGLVFLWVGIVFCGIAMLGLLRFPDMYTRLHATGKVSTVGLAAILLGAACLMPSAALKLIALLLFAVLTMPVSTHVIAAAGYRAGIPMRVFSRDDLAGQAGKVEPLGASAEPTTKDDHKRLSDVA